MSRHKPERSLRNHYDIYRWRRRYFELFLQTKTGAVLALSTVMLVNLLYPTGYAGAASSTAVETIHGQVTQVETAKTSDEKIAEWNKWARDHAYRLESIQPAKTGQETDSFSDLEMLRPLLHDKRMVFLGESSHGVAEFNLAKTRLIQFCIRKWDTMFWHLRAVSPTRRWLMPRPTSSMRSKR